jgi:hypothetical protein
VNAYVCVYRHHPATNRERERTADSPFANELVHQFLAEYDGSYLDWGDDPSFFAAGRLLGDARRASWGVCRPDVRDALHEDGFVVFFAEVLEEDRSDYFWTGVGSVGRRVRSRKRIWTDPALSPYRGFFNLLVTSSGEHREYFHPPHKKDWQRRQEAPYVVFDPALSRFDLQHPLHVSTYRADEGVPDRWRIEDSTVAALEALLFGDRPRRLRTSHTGFGHAKLHLHGSAQELPALRDELIRLFDSRKETGGPPRRRAVPPRAKRSGGCA